jgi:uncharacterized protein (DUF169 family)
MKTQFKEYFTSQWKKYFADSELPNCYYYTNEVRQEDLRESTSEHRCLICNLNTVRQGLPYVYDAKTPGCPGGKRYCGFITHLRPGFEYFLSYGIPGKMEGERYKKSPELVKEFLETSPPIKAPCKYLVFKRWDRLREEEQPLAVVFFAKPDVLSGLFTLANYDLAKVPGVITPMGAGCATLLNYPLVEASTEQPKCVLGMFDVSARPCVPSDTLTFTVPMRRFEQMVANMDESFLITESWKAVRERL